MAACKLWSGLALLLLVLGVSACQQGDVAPCDEGGTLFSDDFEGEQRCGWVSYDRSGARVEIADGVLRLTSSQPGQIWWTNPGRSFDDVIITAEVEHVSGPQDNAFGVVCRYQSSENFYVFLISSDGYYAIGKYQSGSNQVTYLTGEGQYVFSEAINQGQARNSIRAECDGNELTISANGEQLESVTDPTFVTGDIGVAASTFQPGTLVVTFDNLRVLVP